MMRGSIRGVLIDLSGTVHVDNRLIEGSREALLKLRQNGIRYRFVTNTTKESVGRLHQRLKDFNLDVKKEEIFTSLIAARKLLQVKTTTINTNTKKESKLSKSLVGGAKSWISMRNPTTLPSRNGHLKDRQRADTE